MANEFTNALEIELRREEEDYRDLKNDLDFVVDLNRQIADKYEDLMSSFPTTEELKWILDEYDHRKALCIEEDKALEMDKRVFQLKRFMSALVLLEKQDHRSKPQRYSEEKFDAV